MNAAHLSILILAGLAAGTVNAVAGGGSLITFPALLGTGLAQIPANVTNSVSVSPGYLASAYGSRQDLPDRRGLAKLVPATVIGTAIGCALLLLTPARIFKFIVPFLVLLAAFVLAFQQRLRGVVGHPRDMTPRRRTLALQGIIGIGSVYGGYFGAALGVMLVAGIGLVLDENLNRINAIKNLVSTVVGFSTVLAFAVFGPVNWADVAIVAPATIVGGYLGAKVARRLPAPILRGVIVTIAFVVGIVLLMKAFS